MKPETLLRLYPRAWRERYEAEFAAMLSQAPMTARDYVDVMRLAVAEWRWHTGIDIVLVPSAVSALSYVLGTALRHVIPAPGFASPADALLTVAWASVLVAGWIMRDERHQHPYIVAIAARRPWYFATLALAVLAGALRLWSRDLPDVFVGSAFEWFGTLTLILGLPSFVIAFPICIARHRARHPLQAVSAIAARVPRHPLGLD